MSSGSLKLIDTGMRALLYSRFSSILSLPSIGKGVLLWPKETALRKFSEKKGKTQLEFISFMKTGVRKDLIRSRTPAARRGITLSYVDSDTKVARHQVKTVPVGLDYEIRFWSQDLDKLNEVTESFLFWKYQDPNLNMNYDDKFPLEFDLLFGENLVDESTTFEEYDKGKYHVLKADITVEGWVFSGIEIKTIHTVVITFWDKNDIETPYSEVLDEDDSSYSEDLITVLKLFTKNYDLT